jgi:small conductance mechanosensitive channel
MNMENLEQKLQPLLEPLLSYGSKLALALLVLAFGWWLIGRLMNLMNAGMKRANVEVTLRRFLKSFVGIGMKVVLLIIFASMVGVETASLIALLGAAGLAVGLALQGSLANFAGGVLILFFRPFKAGDIVEAQGYTGHIEEIQIFNTIMRTLDNQRVIIPNGLLSNGCVKNLFAEPTRRVDLTFGISYGDDLAKTRQVLQQVLDADDRILKDPPPDIFVSEHGASSVNFLVRPWVNSDDYWPVYFGTVEAVKLAFDREGITIPFPQRDVHFYPAGE